MRAEDLDPDRGVYRTRERRVVHLYSNCSRLQKPDPKRVEAGTLWGDERICKVCRGDRAKPPGCNPPGASISPGDVAELDPEDLGLSPMGVRR